MQGTFSPSADIVDLSQKGNTKMGKGLAPNSVNCIILVLHSSLSMAYVLGLSKEIHVDKIKRPKTSEKPIESFTKDEQKIIERIIGHDNKIFRKLREPGCLGYIKYGKAGYAAIIAKREAEEKEAFDDKLNIIIKN